MLRNEYSKPVVIICRGRGFSARLSEDLDIKSSRHMPFPVCAWGREERSGLTAIFASGP